MDGWFRRQIRKRGIWGLIVVAVLAITKELLTDRAAQWANSRIDSWLEQQKAWGRMQALLANIDLDYVSILGWSIISIAAIVSVLILWFESRNRTPPVRPQQIESAPTATEPNYEQWDKSESLTLWNAAHLWAEQEPIIDHPGGPPPFYEIFTNLKAAADGNILPVHLGGGQYGHTEKPANRYTVAHRDDLKRFAREQRQERPKFLFPEWRLTRKEAIDALARKMEEFLETHFNRRPQTAIDQEHWWAVFLTWRDREIRPLVERLHGQAAAANFSTFVSFEPKVWDPHLGPRFNQIKTMMEITLHRIKKIIEDASLRLE